MLMMGYRLVTCEILVPYATVTVKCSKRSRIFGQHRNNKTNPNPNANPTDPKPTGKKKITQLSTWFLF